MPDINIYKDILLTIEELRNGKYDYSYTYIGRRLENIYNRAIILYDYKLLTIDEYNSIYDEIEKLDNSNGETFDDFSEYINKLIKELKHE